MGYIRRMVKGGFNRRDGTWSYQYTNSDLLRIANTTELSSFIEKQQDQDPKDYDCNFAWEIAKLTE